MTAKLSLTTAGFSLLSWCVATLILFVTYPATFSLEVCLVILGGCCVSTGGIVLLTHRQSKTLAHDLKQLQRFANSHDSSGQAAPPAKWAFSETSEAGEALTGATRRLVSRIRELETTAYVDPITGLPNRTRLLAIMNDKLIALRKHSSAAYVHIVLEGLGSAGEVLGVLQGQALLEMVADRLTEALEAQVEATGASYTLAALRGDCFGLFLPDQTDRKQVSKWVRLLSASMSAPFAMDGRVIQLGLKGGAALAPEDGQTPQVLMKNAELAFGELIASERNGFEFFTPRLDRVARGRRRLESELRAAVANKVFQPVFQPKVDLATGDIVSAEALARWQHDGGRMIAPSAFIPLAEQLGLIGDIGEQILRASCYAAAEWLQQGHKVSLAVNVSPRQFDRDDFADTVIDALRQAGLPPRWLELEITEAMAISDPERLIDVMAPLRAMGIRLAIDDFGTGHANLSTLTKLPFDVFKIDRQFVSVLQSDPQAPAIVETMLAMAETLGLKTVAEGVETEAQQAFLFQRGCTLGQGYLYSPGIAREPFLELLAGWSRAGVTAELHRIA